MYATKIKELIPTKFDGYMYVINTRGTIVGIAEYAEGEGAKYYMVFDRVKLIPDSNGKICPGIKTATSKASIIDVVERDAGDWLYIVCENNEKGYCKPDRVKVVESSEYETLVRAGLIKKRAS